MRLVSAILARNEAGEDRYLRRVLARCREFSDDVLLLDDGSTDATRDIAKERGCIVHRRVGSGFWGVDETSARRELWELGAELAGGGWLLICDADMVLAGDPRSLCNSWECGAWAFCLADMWESEDTFRVDGFWGIGCNTPRPWLFKPSAVPQGFEPRWPEKCAIHVGHCPQNFCEAVPTFIAPPEMFWLHYSYLRKEHREAKAAQYAAITPHLSDFQRRHAESILDA